MGDGLNFFNIHLVRKPRKEPSLTSNPFTDVKTTDYFYKPVLWAKEKGITSGTSATTFSPGKACTRAQAMTFLY
ncbi:MAG: S-layer homology domain-containing protein [Oscillospiraceae bacterium]|nr:S-layer homology domain-containing protein [Oscillospiraceae bacterium]